jgi:2-polyprenyl-3-methyl-5-hydroxy-6-metoxy-1,4-benzoquinol methylase
MKCKFCQSNNIMSQVNQIHNHTHYICTDCKLEFFINNADEKITNDLYENDLDYTNDLNISTDYNSLIQWNHLKAFKFLKKNVETIKTTLDVGAYNGFFVKFLLECNINTYGFDFNSKAVKIGIQNYDLEKRLVDNIDSLKIKKFDCITAFEIIEHLDEPTNFILDMKELLHDDGYLIISSPNNKMMWRPPLDNPPHHLLRINSHTLSNFLKLNGFKTVVIYEQMSLFDLTRNYFGLFFRDNTKNSLKGGEFKDINKVNRIKKILNKIRPIITTIFIPFDKILHLFGFRYISQVVIAKKINEKN